MLASVIEDMNMKYILEMQTVPRFYVALLSLRPKNTEKYFIQRRKRNKRGKLCYSPDALLRYCASRFSFIFLFFIFWHKLDHRGIRGGLQKRFALFIGFYKYPPRKERG